MLAVLEMMYISLLFLNPPDHREKISSIKVLPPESDYENNNK